MTKEKRELSPWGMECKIQMLSQRKSLADLSKATKFSRTYISSIINGRIVAPEETIKVISKALDVDAGLPR